MTMMKSLDHFLRWIWINFKSGFYIHCKYMELTPERSTYCRGSKMTLRAKCWHGFFIRSWVIFSFDSEIDQESLSFLCFA